MADFTGAQYAADEVLAGIKKNQISGIPPKALSLFSIAGGDGKATIKWEAEDTIVEDQKLCKVAGVIIRRSAEDYPASAQDGELVINTAQTSGTIEDTGLTNDQTYYYAAFPYSDHGIMNLEGSKGKVTPKAYTLLGFKIKKGEADPAARVSYTEMAVGLTPASVNLSTGAFNPGGFGGFWFMTENKPCMVKNDGTVDYYLDPNDYTKKENGQASDVSNQSYAGNAMAQIPLVWLKCWEDSNYEYVNVCDVQLDSSYKAYAHTRKDGSIADFVYLSLFEGALVSSKIRSLKGLTPMASQTGTNELTYAKANGSLWSTRSWSQRNLINMLLVLICKTTDLQKALGYGYYTGGTSSSPNLLQTGGASNKGQFYGKNATRDYVKVFHLENYWGDLWERIEGCVTNGSTHIMIKPTPDYNTGGSGYTDTGIVPGGTSGGHISAETMKEYGLIPKTASGSETTYIPDGLWFAANCYALVGGNCTDGLPVGPFALHLNAAVSYSSWNIGAALSCQQPTA